MLKDTLTEMLIAFNLPQLISLHCEYRHTISYSLKMVSVLLNGTSLRRTTINIEISFSASSLWFAEDAWLSAY